MTRKKDPKEAPPELLILARWEAWIARLFQQTSRWPRNLRASLTNRIENLALDLTLAFVRARYDKAQRPEVLEKANLDIESIRHLFRLALVRGAMSQATWESLLRGLDEIGRMLRGWRTSCETAGLQA